MDNEKFKVFPGVGYFNGVYKSNNLIKALHSYGAHLMAGPFSTAV